MLLFSVHIPQGVLQGKTRGTIGTIRPEGLMCAPRSVLLFAVRLPRGRTADNNKEIMYNLFDMLTVVYKYKKLYERKCSEVMKKYELRIADLDILYYIAHSGQKNLAKDIADMGMSKANVSKSVEHLRRKGLVVLSEDEEDRRCLHIEVTEAAQPVIHDISMVRMEMGESLSRGIADADKEAVVRVMRQIGQNMNSELMKLM